MTSRITRATFTVVGFAGLVLLGLSICSLRAGRANAQRIDSPINEEVTAPLPVLANPSPVVRAGNRYHPTQSTTASPFSDQAPRFENQLYDASSAALMQPIVVAIKEGPELRGEPVELRAIQVKTIFGPVSIPIDRIAGVRTADDSRQPATICLSNGDSLTGMLSTDSITIKTEWGTATIARDHIVSIVTSAEPVTWQQHEGRWRIIPVEQVTRAADTGDTNEQVKEVDAGAQPTELDFPTPASLRPSGSEPTRPAEPSLN